MPYKQKATPGTAQLNESAAELPEKERRLKQKFNSDINF